MNDSKDLFSPAFSFAGLRPPYCDLAGAQAIILPVPYDLTSEWHSGSREGPCAIINTSQYLELYDIELDREIYLSGIHTLPELEIVLDPVEMTERIAGIVRSIASQSKLPVTLGGEHSISLGAIKALKERHDDLCVLQLDAHADLRDTYQGTPYSHACIGRRISEHCPLVQAGIRSLCMEERDFIAKNNLSSFLYQSPGLPLEEIVESLGNTVYVTIDLDVFDPAFMSAVATPEPGGMTWHETLALLRTVAERKKIVGFDVVELCPSQGPASCVYTASKLVYKLIGYINR